MTRVLALTRYGRAGPSSRVRTYQFLPQLQAAGLEVDIRPLFGDAYVRRLYGGRRRRPAEVAGALLRRGRTAVAPPAHDVVWVEKEAFPYLPAWLEGPLTARLGPMLAEYDDALFHLYDQSASPVVRALLGRKIDAVMRRAAVVVAGNAYIAERARAAGARRVEILPTVVDVEAYSPARRAADGPAVVGWIGTPVTAPYLQMVAEPLQRLQAAGLVRLRLIGAGDAAPAGLAAEHASWSEAGETAALADLDVGIMPLTDTPWERGKCGYKLIQYMAAALPVVASPVGANRDIVVPGETGFLAANPDQWLLALEQLARAPALRARMGDAGRRRAEAMYSTAVVAPRLGQLLREAASARARTAA